MQSNTFSIGYGTEGGATITGNQAGYDGTNNAWLLSKNADWSHIYQNISQGGVWTASIHAKAGTTNWLALENSGIAGDTCYFDLSSGVTGSTGIGVIGSSIKDIGNGWYRCSVTINGTSIRQRIYPAFSNGNINGGNGNIYIQDFQLEQGLVARDYIETTTTALYGGITDNVPRLDYTDSSCPALLLEPQRTNLYTHSEYGGIWNKTLATITDNYAVSPEGVQNAFRANFSNNNGLIYVSGTGATGQDNTLSVWAKSNTGTDQVFRFFANGNTIKSDNFTATNEWQRFTYTHNCINVTAGITGNSAGGTSDILFYGLQQEAGSYATSYIPTYGTSVTRNADLGSSSYTGVTSTSGTLFFDLKEGFEGNRINSGVASLGLRFSSTGTNNSIGLRDADGRLQGVVRIEASSTYLGTHISGDTAHKVCFVWTPSYVKIFQNGVLTETASVSTTRVYNTFDLPNTTRVVKAAVNQVLTFPSALTDQEAIDLTTI